MKKNTQQLLLSRRTSRASSLQDSSSDGLLDLLSNVLGVLVLVSSLTGVLAATSALNIQAPMRTETKKSSGCCKRRKMVFGTYSQQLNE